VIAAFGPNTPPVNTPQTTVMTDTIYGISKLAGERLCEYYSPSTASTCAASLSGVISFSRSAAAHDYAIAIFHAALRGERMNVLDRRHAADDLHARPIRATIELMHSAGGPR